jgi:hypothetical protein
MEQGGCIVGVVEVRIVEYDFVGVMMWARRVMLTIV